MFRRAQHLTIIESSKRILMRCERANGRRGSELKTASTSSAVQELTRFVEGAIRSQDIGTVGPVWKSPSRRWCGCMPLGALAYPYATYPLRFLKQVAVMFFSACGPSLQEKNPDLVRFVLNRDERQLPPHIQFFAYLHHPRDSTAIRQSGLTGVITGGKDHLFAEIAYPPFGLIMSTDRPPIHRDLCNISHLNQYRFREWDIIYLKLPVFPVTTWLPGDFRTVDEVKRDVEENRKVGSIILGDKIPDP
jgi:hypothetical protein